MKSPTPQPPVQQKHVQRKHFNFEFLRIVYANLFGFWKLEFRLSSVVTEEILEYLTKPPAHPKSLATFSHEPAGAQTQTWVGDRGQSMETL